MRCLDLVSSKFRIDIRKYVRFGRTQDSSQRSGNNSISCHFLRVRYQLWKQLPLMGERHFCNSGLPCRIEAQIKKLEPICASRVQLIRPYSTSDTSHGGPRSDSQKTRTFFIYVYILAPQVLICHH